MQEKCCPPHNFKKVRVESFAKTPNFLKSPRSMASSNYCPHLDQDLNNDILSLKTYNEESEQEINELKSLKQQRTKLS